MPMPNLEALNERLSAMIAEMTKYQRALEKEIAAQNAPATVQVDADELADLRAKAAAKAAPASTPVKETK